MKKAILFKTLVDILYMLHIIGFVGMIVVVPFGTVTINQIDAPVEDWSILFWVIFIISLLTFIIFLRGLYFLRKMARYLLTNKYFSTTTINNLKESGNSFLVSGIVSLTLLVLVWIGKLTGGKFEVTYDNNLLIPLFLCIIGMFFIIQSNALRMAKRMKEENELTV